MKKLYKKNFEHKGQMINYYNKLRKDERIDWVVCCLNANDGYVCEWQYK